MNPIAKFFSKPIFSDKRFILFLWIMLVLVASAKYAFRGIDNNNYLIFEHVFKHTIQQVNLYAEYPQYLDHNYYGPVFSLLIAPFTLLPSSIGCVLWQLCITLSLFLAIYKLPLDWKYRVPIYYICSKELITSIVNMQTNALIAALIIGTFIAIHKEKDFWAACFIALGVFVKLYGIVGLSFFFFSRHKPKLILSLLFWSIVFFVLPMLISSPQFIIQSYQDWFHALISKNVENQNSIMQDISVMGMVRRILGNRELSNWIILVPGLLIFALQYVKIKLYDDLHYRLGILASTLLFVVLFSSGSESSTYIIALCGVGIWFILQQRPYNPYVIFLLIFVLLLTSCASTDLVPRAAKMFIRQYSLKALPCFLVWLTLVYQILTAKNHKRTQLASPEMPCNKI